MAEEGKKAVGTLNRISMVMAESRRLELEILDACFGTVFSDEQNRELRQHINPLTELTKEAKQRLAAYSEDAVTEG